MNKELLLIQILQALEVLRTQAVSAALEAYATATADENVAENKYDTLGLEASYLAQGQAQRVEECEEDIAAYKLLAKGCVTDMSAIALGALIHLVNEKGLEQQLFLGPKSGGLVIPFKENSLELEIKIITPLSPIGQALLKREEGDVFDLYIGGSSHSYEILSVS